MFTPCHLHVCHLQDAINNSGYLWIENRCIMAVPFGIGTVVYGALRLGPNVVASTLKYAGNYKWFDSSECTANCGVSLVLAAIAGVAAFVLLVRSDEATIEKENQAKNILKNMGSQDLLNADNVDLLKPLISPTVWKRLTLTNIALNTALDNFLNEIKNPKADHNITYKTCLDIVEHNKIIEDFLINALRIYPTNLTTIHNFAKAYAKEFSALLKDCNKNLEENNKILGALR